MDQRALVARFQPPSATHKNQQLDAPVYYRFFSNPA